MTRYPWLCVVVLLFAACNERVRDVNHDGRIVVACLGDSNTFWVPNVTMGDSWCPLLQARLLAAGIPATVVTFAMPGSVAAPVDWEAGPVWNYAPLAAGPWVQRAIASVPKPDLAVIAWGSNDALHQLDPVATATYLRGHYDTLKAAGIDTLVATVPPITDPASTTAPDTPWRTLATNAALAQAGIPAADLVDFATALIVDFDADPPGPPTPRVTTRDGVHINLVGQARRASATVTRLMAAP